MHPIVDGIESEYSSTIKVYRLDYRNPNHKRYAHFYAVRTHPVVLVLNGAGNSIKRWDGVVSPTLIQAFINTSSLE